MTNPTFKFSVSGNPAKFSYEPTEDWVYTHEDEVRFETASGPFSLDLINKDDTQSVALRPFPTLQSQPGKDTNGNPVFLAITKINDGLTPAQREDAIEGHRTSEKDPGFIARYRYKFTVTMPDKTTAIDDQKNGEYRC
jgi:hypothetical protein